MAARAGEEAAPKGSIDAPLILLRVVIAVVAFLVVRSGPVHEDEVVRFEEIAGQAGRPYRDFPVEYAPVELIAIELISSSVRPSCRCCTCGSTPSRCSSRP